MPYFLHAAIMSVLYLPDVELSLATWNVYLALGTPFLAWSVAENGVGAGVGGFVRAAVKRVRLERAVNACESAVRVCLVAAAQEAIVWTVAHHIV